MSWT
jgi:hypothetical protein